MLLIHMQKPYVLLTHVYMEAASSWILMAIAVCVMTLTLENIVKMVIAQHLHGLLSTEYFT